MELSEKIPSLLDIQTRYEREIDALRKEVYSKKIQNAQLHSMIQATQNTSDGISDADVSARFGTLSYQISQFAANNFGSFRNDTDHPSFNTMKENDQSLFLMAGIANTIYDDLFNSMFFGLEGALEQGLADLERELDRRRGMSSHVCLFSESMTLTCHTKQCLCPR